MTAGAAEPGERLMTPAELAGYLGGEITEGTLQHWRNKGGGPPFIKLSHHFVRYRLSEVDAWLAERERGQVPA